MLNPADKPKTLKQALAELTTLKQKPALVPDWRAYLPPGSIWVPGDRGKPDCSICHGLGYISPDVPRGHPLWGKAFPCECWAEESRMESAQRLQAASGLFAPDHGLTWAGIQPRAGIGEGLQAVRSTLAQKWGWVYLHGAPGNGKSLILRTAIAESLRAGVGAVYVRWDAIFDHLRAAYNQPHSDFDERLAAWAAVGVLAIDEIGRARETEWVSEQMHKLLDARYNAACYQRSITLFASNYSTDIFDVSLQSRFQDGRFKVCAVTAPDARPAATKE